MLLNMNDPLPPMPHGVKVSDVFMEYVEPFLNQLVLDRAQQGVFDFSIKELDTALRVPWCIWNAIIAEGEAGNEIDFLAWIDTLTKDIPSSIKNLLDFMKERKREQFSQYKYYFGQYSVYYDKNNELRIRVEARAPVR